MHALFLTVYERVANQINCQTCDLDNEGQCQGGEKRDLRHSTGNFCFHIDYLFRSLATWEHTFSQTGNTHMPVWAQGGAERTYLCWSPLQPRSCDFLKSSYCSFFLIPNIRSINENDWPQNTLHNSKSAHTTHRFPYLVMLTILPTFIVLRQEVEQFALVAIVLEVHLDAAGFGLADGQTSHTGR